MLDLFQAKAAGEILDRISGNIEGLCQLTDVELSVVRSNQFQSSTLIANAFIRAAEGDGERCARFLRAACDLEPEDIRQRAMRAVERLKTKKAPSLSQFAALMLVGRAEQDAIEEEVARREAAKRGGLN